MVQYIISKSRQPIQYNLWKHARIPIAMQDLSEDICKQGFHRWDARHRVSALLRMIVVTACAIIDRILNLINTQLWEASIY